MRKKLVGLTSGETLIALKPNGNITMSLSSFAAIAAEIWINKINLQADTVTIEDAWLLQGDFYQEFANALSIGSNWHECTKLELMLLDRVPILLCSLTVLYLHQLKLSASRKDIESLIEGHIRLSVTESFD